MTELEHFHFRCVFEVTK